jgi:hypothetical protein
MSSDFVEVNEMWRLCVGNPATVNYPLSDSIWIHLRMSAAQRCIIKELGGEIYSIIGTVIFPDPESIVVFRIKAGV